MDIQEGVHFSRKYGFLEKNFELLKLTVTLLDGRSGYYFAIDVH
jgi:hypothetical protein